MTPDTNREYETYFPEEWRREFSPYGMCFLLALMTSHKLAEGQYSGRIPFILDIGNPYANHVREAHATALQMQKETFLHAGGLYFDDDAEFGVLQAADVIAWGSRRIASGGMFPPGMEPIAKILLKEQAHHEHPYKTEWLMKLGEALSNKLIELRAKEELERENEEDF